MVEQQPSKLNTRVRFPPPAPFSLRFCAIDAGSGRDDNVTTEISCPLVHLKGDLNIRDKNQLVNLERVEGIEPSYSAWKAAALPLSYTRAVAAAR